MTRTKRLLRDDPGLNDHLMPRSVEAMAVICDTWQRPAAPAVLPAQRVAAIPEAVS